MTENVAHLDDTVMSETMEATERCSGPDEHTTGHASGEALNPPMPRVLRKSSSETDTKSPLAVASIVRRIYIMENM